MQKLVIQTQYRENYAAHDQDYVHGVSEAHWKFKGGTTYVVPNFKDFDGASALVSRLAKLITFSNSATEEYILTWNIVDHAEKVCEDWEAPVQLHIDGLNVTALKVTKNDEFGYMRSEILEKTESWTMRPENERDNYKVEFLMNDGDFAIGDKGLREWIGSKDDPVLPEAV